MYTKGTFFRNFKNKKIVKIEVDGEKFTVKFSDGEVLSNLTLNEVNHIVITATGR